MNKLSYNFTKEGGLTENFIGGYQILLDGRNACDFFHEPGFILSAERDGIFPMFYGACATFGCCGLYVEVKTKDDKVIWEKFWDKECGGMLGPKGELEPKYELKEFKFLEDFVIKPPLVFDRDEYRHLAERMTEDSKKIPERYTWLLDTMERYKSGDTFEI